MRLGRPLSEWKGQPDYNALRSAVDTFPDVQSCLVESERGAYFPNLTRFDWARVKQPEDAEVCMFRVFSSIEDIEQSKEWLRSQWFDVENTTYDGIQYNVTSYIPVRTCGERLGRDGQASSSFDRLVELLFSSYHTLATHISFGAGGKVTGVGIGFLSK
jgi:hypothetical protein